MNLASAAAATTTTALPFKTTSLSLLRCHVHPHKPHLLYPLSTTSTLLPGRRAWFTGDGDGLHRWSAASPETLHRSFKFRRTAVSLGSGTIVQDAVATVVVMGGAYALVLAFDILTQRDFIEQKLSRKLVHILSGLLFMACWPIFSTSTEARYFASLVPLANCLKLVTYGLSLATDEGLIKSVTREGKPVELLRGPLYYVLILVMCVLIFWRESPVGVISLAMMCGGDGVADIMGRKFGSVKIPYNKNKSWAGSISMFIFGFLISMGPWILPDGFDFDNGKSSFSCFRGNGHRVPPN
ncbi:probable phytol kinase 1, chloroplastic isoform X2 [Rhododendron vialii]|uniref:probable phytol kinase 1, chloroplastic isoform X2 n=1 Tax=Rhododendron vialii TaxID=182163 RepID=UPI00265F3C3C|nr:probable phytol kinase 1, chloroplastic isoform X2 [Rhododendron vialii]